MILKILKYSTLISLVFLLMAFSKERSFFNQIGLNVVDYLEISELIYRNIGFLFLCFCSYPMALFFGQIKKNRFSKTESKTKTDDKSRDAKTEKSVLIRTIKWTSITTYIVIIVVLNIFKLNEHLYFNLTIVAILLSIAIIPYIVGEIEYQIDKFGIYTSKYAADVILILVLLFLLGNMHGYNKAIHLKNKDQSGQYEFVVALDKGGNEKVHTGKLNLIDLSNNFLILFDKQSEEVTIYNRNHILKTKKKW